MKDTKQAKRNQNCTKKKRYGSDTQPHKTESDLTKKKLTQLINWNTPQTPKH